MATMNEAEARLWNKTAKCGYTCKACGLVFLLEDVTWHDTTWEDIEGEEWLVEVRNKCPHCGEIRGYAPNELELHQPSENGRIPPN